MGELLNIVRFEPLTYFFKGITFLGNEEFFCLFIPFTYWCWKKRAGTHLIILLIISAYINILLKDTFEWPRPPTDLWLISAKGFTFPSSHAALAVVVWGFLAGEVRRRWFTILAVSLIILISASRIYLGVHYPQDVLAGLAAGTLFLYTYRLLVKWFGNYFSRINDIVKGVGVILISIGLLLLHPSIRIASGMGFFAGVSAGFLLEPHFADFDSSGGWIQKILRSLVGLIILLAIWQGFEWIFPDTISFKWFQFFILGGWVTAGAPWLFVQLRLAEREP